MSDAQDHESTLLYSELPELQLISRGKVRDIYATSSPDHLLFVASDRISAYDVILRNVSMLLHVDMQLLIYELAGHPG